MEEVHTACYGLQVSLDLKAEPSRTNTSSIRRILSLHKARTTSGSRSVVFHEDNDDMRLAPASVLDTSDSKRTRRSGWECVMRRKRRDEYGVRSHLQNTFYAIREYPCCTPQGEKTRERSKIRSTGWHSQ